MSMQGTTEVVSRPGMSRLFWVGLALLCLGTGPLLLIIIAAELGLTRDPNPNPIGPGLLAGVTLWPSLIIFIIGIVRSVQRRRALRAK